MAPIQGIRDDHRCVVVRTATHAEGAPDYGLRPSSGLQHRHQDKQVAQRRARRTPLFEPPKGRFKRVAFSLVAPSEVEAPRSDLTPAARPPFDKPVLSNVEGLSANGGSAITQ